MSAPLSPSSSFLDIDNDLYFSGNRTPFSNSELSYEPMLIDSQGLFPFPGDALETTIAVTSPSDNRKNLNPTPQQSNISDIPFIPIASRREKRQASINTLSAKNNLKKIRIIATRKLKETKPSEIQEIHKHNRSISIAEARQRTLLLQKPTSELTKDEIIIRRKEKNRLAAKKSRNNMKSNYENQAIQIETLKRENELLTIEIKRLNAALANKV